MLRSLPAIRALLFRLGQRQHVLRSVFKLDGFIEAAGPGHSGQFCKGAGANLCQINVDQSDGRHSFVFFWIESVPIKFAACGMLNLRSELIEIL
jgi:hypothetical protein